MTISDFLLMNVGGDGIGIPQGVTTAADPQLQFFENFPGKDVMNTILYSNSILSVHAVNIPLSLSFNYPVFLLFEQGGNATRSASVSISFGLYSLNGATLSLANSASGGTTWEGVQTSTFWMSLATSTTQNITPGAWYFAVNASATGPSILFRFYGNSSINPENAAPVLVRGRMTVSTGAMPGSIATNELDITGSDAIRQPYIIITA